MSSDRFEVILKPDPRMRALVFGSGILLAFAGAGALAVSGLPPAWRGLVILAWAARTAIELGHSLRGCRRVRGLILNAGGAVSVHVAGGRREAATLLTGSVVLPAAAWLRLGLAGGERYGELLLRVRSDPATWHRLQLAWQFSRQSFGHPDSA